jgi:uncharacterized protein with PIN domain
MRSVASMNSAVRSLYNATSESVAIRVEMAALALNAVRRFAQKSPRARTNYGD